MIYFDNAATTKKKPDTVARAMMKAVKELTSPGRGGHDASMKAADAAYACREAAAALFSVSEPERVVFTHNATHALNMAIKSIVKAGDRVVISGYEHNSVTRPLYAVGAEVAVAPSKLFCPDSAIRAFDEAVTADTKLVVCNHVSNVFGFILPIEAIADMCKERGVPFILDASQSAGVCPIDAEDLGADFIAMPGHKGLYGPQGTGILICKDRPAYTIIEGGTGSDTHSFRMPEILPDRLEAGTHNMPGISGLLEGIRFLGRRGIEQILIHERMLLRRLINGIGMIPGLQDYASEDEANQTGVLAFRLDGVDCETLASALGERGVALRAGLHCSPLAHESAGTAETGTLRVSFSVFNTEREVDRFLCILEHTGKNLRKGERILP